MSRKVRRSAGTLAVLVLATVVQGFGAGGAPPAAAADPLPRGARLVVAIRLRRDHLSGGTWSRPRSSR